MSKRSRTSYRVAACLAVFSLVAVSVPTAAAAPDAVARFKDWQVFRDAVDGAQVCYAATPATDKAPKAADHGEVWFYITSWRDGRSRNQPSLRVGYPLREDLPSTARVGRASYPMFNVGQEAFADDADDPRLVRAIERGLELRVEAVSARDTTVAYHFSLSGSADAIEKAAAICR